MNQKRVLPPEVHMQTAQDSVAETLAVLAWPGLLGQAPGQP